MTTMATVECVCSVCGAKNEYWVLASTNAFGSSDLDLRPPEMQRSTMEYWVQECTECGYVSEEVSDVSNVTKEWLQSEKYLLCDGMSFSSGLAKKFYKYYLINLEDKNVEDAFLAVLHAAWVCDDNDEFDNAKNCRQLAIQLADNLIKENEENADNLLLIKADLMRRSGDFYNLILEYSDVKFDDDLLNEIVSFQLQKANEKDTACYTVGDVKAEL